MFESHTTATRKYFDETHHYAGVDALLVDGEWYRGVTNLKVVKTELPHNAFSREWEVSFSTPEGEYSLTPTTMPRPLSITQVTVAPLSGPEVVYSDVTHVSVDYGVLTLVLWGGRKVNYVLSNIEGWVDDPAA